MDSTRHLSQFVLDFFPPPRFLEMPAVGLNISDTALTVIELLPAHGSCTVGRWKEEPLSRGVVAGGDIIQREEFIQKLRVLKDELSLHFVSVSLSEEKAYLFKTIVPRVSPREVRSVLEFKLEENVPLPPEEAVFEYALLGEKGTGELEVAVTVLPRKVVTVWSEAIVEAGLTPRSFDIEAQAIARAVIDRDDAGTYLIIHFGEAKTGLFIVSQGAVRFTSMVAIGGEVVTAAIAKSLSISVEEAKKIKERRVVLKDRKNMDIFYLLVNAVSALKDEVNKLSIYWRTHKTTEGDLEKPIRKIILTGQDAGLPGFDDYLASALNVEVEIGNVWRNAFSFDRYIPPIPFDDSLTFAGAVGLALPRRRRSH